MLRKQRYLTLGLVVVATVILGVILPRYMNDQVDRRDSFFFTPLPTSTRFSEPLTDIMDVFEAGPSDVIEPEVVSLSHAANCTYPIYYWQNHPDSWPAEVAIGGTTYTKEAIRRLFAGGESDIPTLLVRQIYGVFLNILYGAEMAVVEEPLSEAVLWLNSNPPQSGLSEFNRQRGAYLTEVLEGYNNGVYGPGLCKDAPGTPTATPSPTPSWTAVGTATRTAAPRSSGQLFSRPTSTQGSSIQSQNTPALPLSATASPTTSPFSTPLPTLPIFAFPTSFLPLPGTATLAPTLIIVTSTPIAILPTAEPSIAPTIPPPSSTPVLPGPTAPPAATATSIPPTVTSAPLPSATPMPTAVPLPTNTLPPPTATPQPTNTLPPPTATEPPPPTNTQPPPPPTNTLGPPTPTNTPNTPPGQLKKTPSETPDPFPSP